MKHSETASVSRFLARCVSTVPPRAVSLPLESAQQKKQSKRICGRSKALGSSHLTLPQSRAKVANACATPRTLPKSTPASPRWSLLCRDAPTEGTPSGCPAGQRHTNLKSRISVSCVSNVICMAKRGPKPRPGRNPRPIACIPHQRVADALQAGADKHGVPRGVYMDYVLSHALDLGQFAPDLPPVVDHQEALPLDKSA